MIQITPTPHYAGVTITGDFYNFDQLYEALHKIVGDEEKHPDYYNARLRVLGLFYDLRHANRAHREYAFKNHGLDEETLQWMGIVSTNKNVYLSFNTYYPEILFIIMALNDFVDMYNQTDAMHSKWDLTVQTVRKFQATVIDSLRDTLPRQKFNSMLRNMSRYSVDFSNYFTRYLDQLNIRFLGWDQEKRFKNISIMAKRIAERGKEYQQVHEQLMQAAIKHNCDPNELVLNEDYPDYMEIDW
ncbi:DUF6904 family protein [Oceanobacillus saliphilus]|uniref:DUF6904 family protein n=1 Tax=Oceanobacillus saliphilus TaxID=2925834 RepID=UPI00201E204C|nr:hypothetical protein [Oceanobacillus saliphilus]